MGITHVPRARGRDDHDITWPTRARTGGAFAGSPRSRRPGAVEMPPMPPYPALTGAVLIRDARIAEGMPI